MPRDHAAARGAAPFFALWFDGLRAVGREAAPGRLGLHLPAGERAPLPGPEDLADAMHQAGYTEIAWRLLGGGIVALHTATRGAE